MSLAPEPDRIEELLVEEAVFGLSPELRAELDTLLVTSPEQATTEFEQAAAVYYMAAAPLEIDTMPDALRQRVLNTVLTNLGTDLANLGTDLAGQSTDLADKTNNPTRPEAVLADQAIFADQTVVNSTIIPDTPTNGLAARSGWLLAMAASLLLGFWLGNPARLEEQSLAKARAELLESTNTITQVAWTATETPEADGASGDVVWSDAEQLGYMTFRGLAPNDPTKEQYQLWIFDAERDDKYPVDGGVFDIPSGVDEVITPIQAKIEVNKAVLFAITIEKPGGVVVSDRSRLPLLAKVE